MTSKQKAILEAINAYVRRYKYSPSVRDLRDIVGLKSVSTVHGYLERLKIKGLITWEPDRPRTLKVLIDTI